MNIEPMVYNKIPQFKLRSERETEELLHSARVVARKRQILLLKLDAEYPIEPWNMSTYMHSGRRINLWKLCKLLLIQLRP